MELTGSVALVTGGARRVGKAISLGLARAGATVVVNHHASDADASQTVREIESLGGKGVAIRADVSRKADIDSLVGTIESEFGRLDVLVNSAARFDSAPILKITEEAWDRVMAVNLKGPFLLSQAAAPMLSRRPGVIVNIADLSAFQAWPSYAHHAVSKAGLVHLTRILARALAPVRANCVAPGTVLPPEDPAAPNEQEAGGVRKVVGRDGAPEDVVSAVLYLVNNDFVTGEVLIVDGGRLLL